MGTVLPPGNGTGALETEHPGLTAGNTFSAEGKEGERPGSVVRDDRLPLQQRNVAGMFPGSGVLPERSHGLLVENAERRPACEAPERIDLSETPGHPGMSPGGIPCPDIEKHQK